jgi:hypothetical protein
MTHYARCGIYNKRPEFCRVYPREGDFIPAACTYRFENGVRVGTCQPEVCQENACCNFPRKGGEPEAESLSETEGGKPCKHLVWAEAAPPKTASDLGTYDPGELHTILFGGIR